MLIHELENWEGVVRIKGKFKGKLERFENLGEEDKISEKECRC